MASSAPSYVSRHCAEAILSDVRPLEIAPKALQAVNVLLDELASSVTSLALAESSHHITTENIKLALAKCISPSMSKEAVLEAEIALRELLRAAPPSMRGDAALKKTPSSPKKESPSSEQTFAAIRSWIMLISGLGARAAAAGPSPISSLVDTLRIPPLCPSPAPNVSFVAAFYLERCLAFVADFVLRSVSRSVKASSSITLVSLFDIEAALAADDQIWPFFKDMRTRHWIENEKIPKSPVRTSSLRLIRTPTSEHVKTLGAGIVGNRSPGGRQSVDRIVTPTRSRTASSAGSFGLGIADSDMAADFESLINSNKTMKVSLTPDRLRTMEQVRTPPALAPSAFERTDILTASPGRKLQARSPLAQDLDSDEEVAGGKTPRDDMVNLLSSDPPWMRKGTQSTTNFSPRAPGMEKRDSDSSVQSAGSDNGPAGTGPMISRIKAKDERKDIAQERQVNYDLLDFFADVPPPVVRTPKLAVSSQASFPTPVVVHPIDPPRMPAAYSPSSSPQSSPKSPSPKKSRSGLRGLVSKVTGGRRDSASSMGEQSPTRTSRASISSRAGSVASSHIAPSSGSHTLIDHAQLQPGFASRSVSSLIPADARVGPGQLRESTSSPLHQFAASHGASDPFAGPTSAEVLQRSDRQQHQQQVEPSGPQGSVHQDQLVSGRVTPPGASRLRGSLDRSLPPSPLKTPVAADTARFDNNALGATNSLTATSLPLHTRAQNASVESSGAHTSSTFNTAADTMSEASGITSEPSTTGMTGDTSADDLRTASIGVGTKTAIGGVARASATMAPVALAHQHLFPSAEASSTSKPADQTGSRIAGPLVTEEPPVLLDDEDRRLSAARHEGTRQNSISTVVSRANTVRRQGTIASDGSEQLVSSPSTTTATLAGEPVNQAQSSGSSKGLAVPTQPERMEELGDQRLVSLREAMQNASSVDECLALLDALIEHSRKTATPLFSTPKPAMNGFDPPVSHADAGAPTHHEPSNVPDRKYEGEHDEAHMVDYLLADKRPSQASQNDNLAQPASENNAATLPKLVGQIESTAPADDT